MEHTDTSKVEMMYELKWIASPFKLIISVQLISQTPEEFEYIFGLQKEMIIMLHRSTARARKNFDAAFVLFRNETIYCNVVWLMLSILVHYYLTLPSPYISTSIRFNCWH